jgi:cytochrome c
VAHICHGAGRYEEAEDIFRVLISYDSYNAGGNHAQVFIVSSHLSNTMCVQKRHRRAEELAIRAVWGLEVVHEVDVKHLLTVKGYCLRS